MRRQLNSSLRRVKIPLVQMSEDEGDIKGDHFVNVERRRQLLQPGASHVNSSEYERVRQTLFSTK